jgi:hypothetical protein
MYHRVKPIIVPQHFGVVFMVFSFNAGGFQWGRFRTSKYQNLGAISQNPINWAPFSVKWADCPPLINPSPSPPATDLKRDPPARAPFPAVGFITHRRHLAFAGGTDKTRPPRVAITANPVANLVLTCSDFLKLFLFCIELKGGQSKKH